MYTALKIIRIPTARRSMSTTETATSCARSGIAWTGSLS